MRRSESLASLSRDHHMGLVVAQWLRRGTGETARDDRAALLRFWDAAGSRHFRIEEEVLLPAVARHVSPEEDSVLRVLVDHVEIRRLVEEVRREP